MAEKYYRKALEFSPNNCDTANNLGMLYRQMGRLDDARSTLQRCDMATMAEETRGATFNNIGMLELDLGNNAAAFEHFKAALELIKNRKADPNWATIYGNFETAKQRLG
jgi:Tfp pilus assembly protein PilF